MTLKRPTGVSRVQESFFLYSDQRAEILIKMGRGIRRGKLVKRLAGNSEKQFRQMEKALEAFYETLQVVDKVRSMQNKPSRSNYY